MANEKREMIEDESRKGYIQSSSPFENETKSLSSATQKNIITTKSGDKFSLIFQMAIQWEYIPEN